MTNEEKTKKIIEFIEKTDLPEEAKKVGKAGALIGADSDTIIHGMIAAADSMATRDAEKTTSPQKSFAGYTPVERQVAKMLTENTGIAMMDSGGAYGRAWQRNREVADFRKRPAVEIDVDYEPLTETVAKITNPLLNEKQSILKKFPQQTVRPLKNITTKHLHLTIPQKTTTPANSIITKEIEQAKEAIKKLPKIKKRERLKA